VTETVRHICRLIDKCSDDERRAILAHLRTHHPLETKWGVTADAILTAIARASDLSLRGVRGLIAEAAFEQFVLPTLGTEWSAAAVEGNQAYDFALCRLTDNLRVHVQVKLQRSERHNPLQASKSLRRKLRNPPEKLYIVEVQKTRGGKKRSKLSESGPEESIETRPYRFGEFDVIAVNLHPSTGDWKLFMYTVGNWLLPSPEAKRLIATLQPVAAVSDDFWTDNLTSCIERFLSGESRTLYDAETNSDNESP